MICNVVANPNIRYLIMGGPESENEDEREAVVRAKKLIEYLKSRAVR